MCKSTPHIPNRPGGEADWLAALLDLARFLRSAEGCPWDRKQTTASFARFLGEEADELEEAVEEDDNAHIAEEFGDALFCALMAAVTAEDEGRFDVGEALAQAHAKMIRRHAHLFGEDTAESPEDVVAVWRRIKAEENEQDPRP